MCIHCNNRYAADDPYAADDSYAEDDPYADASPPLTHYSYKLNTDDQNRKLDDQEADLHGAHAAQPRIAGLSDERDATTVAVRQTESKAILASVRADAAELNEASRSAGGALVAATALAAAQEETATLKAALAKSLSAEEAAKSMLATVEAAKAELNTAHKALLVDFLRIQGGEKKDAAEQAVAELIESNAGAQAAPAFPSSFPECLLFKTPAHDTNYDAMLELVDQLAKAQQEIAETKRGAKRQCEVREEQCINELAKAVGTSDGTSRGFAAAAREAGEKYTAVQSQLATSEQRCGKFAAEIKRLEDAAAAASEAHKTQRAESDDQYGLVVQPGTVQIPHRFSRQKTKSLPTKPAHRRNINTAILPSLGAAAAVARARAPGTEKPSMPDRSQRATLGEPKKKPLPSIYDRNHPFPSPYSSSASVATTAHGTIGSTHGGGGVD